MPRRQLDKSTKEMFEREIRAMDAKILEKQHENVKLQQNVSFIQESLKQAINEERKKILLAEVAIEEMTFDMDNKVTLSSTKVKIESNIQEIKKTESNIKVRRDQIDHGVLENPTRDEKAREELKQRMENKDGQQTKEEA